MRDGLVAAHSHDCVVYPYGKLARGLLQTPLTRRDAANELLTEQAEGVLGAAGRL